MINLKDLSIILTGATGGIGNSILDKLVHGGANVLATGTNEDKLEQIKQKYKNVKVERFDISNHTDIESFINNGQQLLDNKIDILINNAGITRDNLSIRMKDEEWNNVIDINLTSTFLLSKHAIKKMIKNKKGKIINITSIVGHTGNVGQANYAASKAGVIAMSKSLALEYGKKNITVNCVSPGFIKSDMTDKINDDYKNVLKSRISLDKFGEPRDIANTVVFLCSEMSDYITGETIHVNGGMYFS
tara:strand:+ start:1331 stop:2068 length:738 start_codon:yes stop_codon:yes gene_type:complete